jgi:dynein heavy chain 2
MDLDTREWFDGILTASARQVVKAAPHEQEWIVCDGDILFIIVELLL